MTTPTAVLSATSLGTTATVIKAWAAAQTPPITTSTRGRLSTEVLTAYAAAHPAP